MKWKIEIGGIYEIVVEADTYLQAFALAFSQRLPLACGEVVCAKQENRQRKSGYGPAQYMATRNLLRAIGAEGIFICTGRKFVLNQNHPDVQLLS